MSHYFSLSSSHKDYGISEKLDGIFFINIDQRLSSWQKRFFDLTVGTDTWLKEGYETIWATQFDNDQVICFKRGYTSTMHEIYFSPKEVPIWRENVFNNLGYPNPNSSCPGKDILLVH
jgi:hypothetical protein